MDDVTLARTGNQEAFARLLTRHQQHICGLALSVVRDVAASEDVAQDAFVRAWRALPTLRDDAAFVGWLRTTTRRLALDAWRERKRRERLRPPPAPPMIDEVEYAEEAAFVNAALNDLNDDDREILIAQLREDLSLKELALRLEVNEAAAQKRLSRARQRLQEKTEERLKSGLRKTAPAAAFVLAVLAGVEAQAMLLPTPASTAPGVWLAALAATIVVGGGVAWRIKHSLPPAPVATIAPVPHASPVNEIMSSGGPSSSVSSESTPDPCPSSRQVVQLMRQSFVDDEQNIATKRSLWRSHPDQIATAFEIGSYDEGHLWGEDGKPIAALELEMTELAQAIIKRCATAPALAETFWLLAKDKIDPTIANAWRTALAEHASDPNVYGNAAHYFLVVDAKKSRELLEVAARLDPKNPLWQKQLAETYKLGTIREPTQSDAEDKEANENALGFLQRVEAQATDASSRFNQLPELAKRALAANENKEAERYANEMIASAPDQTDKRDAGNAVHWGNIVLGELALKQNDLVAAKIHLLAAGETTGSPTLNSFGPDTSLAKQLFDRGEHEVVDQYLQKVGAFWSSGQNCLKLWRNDIAAQQAPEATAVCHWGWAR